MSSRADSRYDPHAIEARRQSAWREREAFRTPAAGDEQPHLYIKPSAPFTSGNIHMGHVRSYSIGDAYARFRRARGDSVLFAFGFDAFGLPAELGAIAGGEPPSEWVSRCAAHMTGQLERLGFSFDWERSFLSSDAVMYRWSQWLFVRLLEAGLIYRGTGNVDWCDTCETTLASIQVERGGTCWRCHGPVRLVELPQWYLRISAYLEENDRRLGELAESGVWDEVALGSQQEVLGRVEGVEVTLEGDGRELTAFTPHGEALADARFVLLSPRHPDTDVWAADIEQQLQQMRSGGWERSAREAETIPLIDTGRTVAGIDGGELPVIVSPLVDSRFGVTVVLGVPAHDRTDAVIARRLGIAVPNGGSDEPSNTGEEAPRGDLPASAAASAGPGQHESSSDARVRPAVRYRAYDFAVSRQRSWGTPIPIVYCEECGAVPVPVEQLPVVLPLDIRPTGAGNPLAELDEFVNVTCPSCGGPARRETDTLDCHFDALWLWVPAAVPPESREEPLEEIFALPDLRRWLPSERLVAGSDSGNFVFDQRIVTKALRDLGPLAFLENGEPFAGCLFHEMVISDGRKMSKHLGNVVDPDELVERYGADAVRLAVLYAARPQRSLNWSDSSLLRAHRFLTQVWDFTQAKLPEQADAQQRAAGDGADEEAADTSEHLRVRLAKWCEAAAQRTTEDMEQLELHSAARNVMRLFDRIKDFEKRVLARDGELGTANLEALVGALALLAQLLGPLAPHVAEELWLALGGDEQAPQVPWPGVSFQVPA
ncbi:MAG TPA: class I tRNA ligase family protein [Solirubrobacteraceae bacterium]|jgi:leucyl-tRNA synthetase|nr:class I tRNA ligase family protein [Solirubrobacteraceae bacterium]